MSSSVSVVVLCPNGRRETIKVSSNNSILQILEEACMKQKLDPGKHELCHYSRILDPSLPVRFANLPNNAFVELRPTDRCRTDQMVTVALQLESGERVTDVFPPVTSLHDILEKSLKSESISLNEIGEPVCIYMRQKISGEAMKTTTLRSLGLTSGKAIIRLLYRKPEDLEIQAHVSSRLVNNQRPDWWKTQPSNDAASRNSEQSEIVCSPPDANKAEQNVIQTECSESASSVTDQNARMDVEEMEDNQSTVKVKIEQEQRKPIKRRIDDGEELNQQQMDCDAAVENEVVEEIGEIIYIGGRHAVIYDLDDITDVKKADLPDDFFDLTIGDARYIMEEYKKQRSQWESQPLLTKEQRDRQLLQKFAQFSQTVIRVYFPERLVLQAVFTVTETVQDVKDFVRYYLEDRDLNFHLYITPPKEILNPSKSLVESMLAPAAVLHFGSDVRLPRYLVPSLRTKLSDPRAAALAASKSRESNISNFTPENIFPENVNNLVSDEKLESSPNSNVQPAVFHAQSDGKVPKWMKLSKK